MATKAGILKAKFLMLLRLSTPETKKGQRNFSSKAAKQEKPNKAGGGKTVMEDADLEEDYSPCWIPHPRTGIYMPKGHEWVMDGVPDNAASFSQTYWLRNVDGVDKPDPDCYTPIDTY